MINCSEIVLILVKRSPRSLSFNVSPRRRQTQQRRSPFTMITLGWRLLAVMDTPCMEMSLFVQTIDDRGDSRCCIGEKHRALYTGISLVTASIFISCTPECILRTVTFCASISASISAYISLLGANGAS